MCVVFFGAHADDVEIGAGGTCAKLAAAGFEVHVVVATDEPDPAIAHRRRAEAISGARALGVPAERVHFLGLPDGDMRCTRASVGTLRTFLTRARLQPVAAFTHTDVDSHNDHVELTRMVRGALRRTTLLKYVVRNSAVVSHFTPHLYSAVDPMLGAKARALLQHTSQVAAGRISIDRLLQFAERYGVAESGQHLEAFDIEVQDGATGAEELLAIVNDAPFSRFWAPVYAAGDLTILAGTGERPLAAPFDSNGTLSQAPGTLELVTRLQSMLLATFANDTQRNLRTFVRVAPRHAALPSAVPSGTVLVLGSTAANTGAAELVKALPRLRFRTDYASTEHEGHPIIDTATGKIHRLAEPAASTGLDAAAVDFGLLTIARTGDRATSRIAIHASGIGPAGLAAAFQCLVDPAPLARIVEGASEVMRGRETVMQWLVPATRAGQPLVDAIVCSVSDWTSQASAAARETSMPARPAPQRTRRTRRSAA